MTRPEEIVYRHFRAVGPSWKYDRNRDRGQPGPGARDIELAAALDALPDNVDRNLDVMYLDVKRLSI